MVEYIDKETPLKKGNLKFFDWLKCHGLSFGDYNSGTKTGNYIVDAGGVTAKSYNPMFVTEDHSCYGSDMDLLLRGYLKNQTADDVLKLIK